MYLDVFRMAWRAVRRHPQIFWLFLWEAVFVSVTAILTMAQAARLFSAHAAGGGSNTLLPWAWVLYAVVLAPYFTAAFYGTLAEVSAAHHVNFKRIAGNGIRYFGRSFGWMLFVLAAWLSSAAVVAATYLALQAVTGLRIAVAGAALAGVVAAIWWSIWLVWAAGGLFVGQLKWGHALKRARIRTRHQSWLTVAILLTAAAGQTLLTAAVLSLTHSLGMAGQVFSALALSAGIIFWTLSFFGLYRKVRVKTLAT